MNINKKVSIMTWILLVVIDLCMGTFAFVDVVRWVKILFGCLCIMLTAALFLNSLFELSEVRREILREREQDEPQED